MLPLIGNAIEVGLAYLFGNEGGYAGRMYNAKWTDPVIPSPRAILTCIHAGLHEFKDCLPFCHKALL